MDVQRDVTLDLEPELAWELVSRADELETWLGVEVDLEPVEGSTGRVLEDDGTERRLVVEEVDEGCRLTWRWWSVEDGGGGRGGATRVEITVEPSGDGTLVRVLERPIGAVPAEASAAGRWSGQAFALEVSALARAALAVV